jgi:protein phosphatase PTC7
MAASLAFRFVSKRQHAFLSGQCRCLHMAFATHNIPHPSKAASGGEDAFFASPATNSFGVADGVSSRVREDADPGVYSRAVLQGCREAIEKKSRAELSECVGSAVQSVVRNQVHGSTTVVLGRLVGNMLETFNLGDSAVMIYRPSFDLRGKRVARWTETCMIHKYLF